MQPSPEEFDDHLRNHTPESTGLPPDFQGRVWQTIQTREEEATSAGWLESNFLANISPLRLAASCSLMVIVFNSLLGIWLGNASLTEPEPILFPMLTSVHELDFLGR